VVVIRTLALVLAVALSAWPAQGAREITRQDVRTLLNAWFVYPTYGSFQLSNGRFVTPSGRIRISMLKGARFTPIEGMKIAALSTLQTSSQPRVLFLSLFTRTAAGYFRDDATVRIGERVRALSLTMRGGRLRVSMVQPNGRQATLIYHVTGRGLQEAATRHAQ
jgi:hypothetical protein